MITFFFISKQSAWYGNSKLYSDGENHFDSLGPFPMLKNKICYVTDQTEYSLGWYNIWYQSFSEILQWYHILYQSREYLVSNH